MSQAWFRMYAEFATDPVVQSLTFEQQRHYVVLLCLKSSGVLDRPMPATVRTGIIQRALGVTSETFHETLHVFQSLNLVDAEWHPCAWDKRQYKHDSSTDRVRKYRETKKTGNVSRPLQETFQKRSRNAPDTDTDTDISTSLRSVERARKTRLPEAFELTPTLLAEIRQHAPNANPAHEFAQFCDYHRARATVMQDWPAAWRTWCRNAATFARKSNGSKETNLDRIARAYREEFGEPSASVQGVGSA